MASQIENGFVLNVYKEVSWTSHDAVDRIRRILGTRKVGHAGSLDPLASGVLLIGVGRATKLVPYLQDLPKRYRGTILLGQQTTTGDSAGPRIQAQPVPALTHEQLQDAAHTFEGIYEQVPPMVSAVRHQGRRLYELARQGVEVERKPRPVEVNGFRILEADLPRVDFEVDCGRGTYIRTLAEDFALRIGTVGTVESLTRTAVGPFESVDACRIIARPASTREGLLERRISMSAALPHLTAARVDGRWIHRIRQGGLPPRTQIELEGEIVPASAVRVLGPEEELLALARFEFMPGPASRDAAEDCALKLERVL